MLTTGATRRRWRAGVVGGSTAALAAVTVAVTGPTGWRIAASQESARPPASRATTSPPAADAAGGEERRTVDGLPPFRAIPFDLTSEGVPLPYDVTPLPLAPTGRPVDEAGIVQYREPDGTLHDHPVVQAGQILGWLAAAKTSDDPRYLRSAVRHGDRLVARSVRSRGARFFPYDMAFPLHGDRRHVMPRPWYSAMAQGQVLAAFLRLHEATGDARWRRAADETFASFTVPRQEGQPWVSDVHPDGSLWLEEYPHPETPDSAYNGHHFALFGVYEYWRATGRPEAADLVRGALTASLRSAPEFRRPGELSRYCLTHDVRSAKYHGIHVRQLYVLAGLSGDPRFARWADVFLADAPAAHTGGPGRLAATGHRLLTLDDDGSVTGVTRVELDRPRAVTFDARARVAGEDGVWLRLASAAHRGRWVREDPASAFVTGFDETYPFTPARRLPLTGTTRDVYRIDVAGRRRVGSLDPRDQTVLVGGRAVHDGLPLVRLAEGPHAGSYLPLAAVVTGPTGSTGSTDSSGSTGEDQRFR
ncbi:putative D-glucuronyl C5-epimerase [Mobilicoccus pelagius]|uniref:Putative D-glucuronyl C5-epimerase n=1 Tax=Mobilicoccus pelagius NBRC 104925 TaxID=1089455 RepID=H5UR67_9MICO|nr:putative D-glucuronyl C5-epimerase [Mobilicoccus pelagius]GAB48225.1 putative D-glucuronyl C5-epimerase [Mobilicoccus pelagius NBRC 104925]